MAALLFSLSSCDACDEDDDDLPPPAPPSGLTVTKVTSGRVELSWTDNSWTETGFRVERSPDGITWTAVGTVGVNVTAFADRGLLPFTQYYYRVSAVGNGGSVPTATVGALTLRLVWSAGTIGGGPTARLEHSAIYDAANQRMVVYGGDDFIYEPTPDTSLNNDVWALDLSTASPAWSTLATGGATAPYLANHTAIYDAPNKRMIVFGGIFQTSMSGGPLNEVWALTLPDDGVSTPTWSQLSPTPDPGNGLPVGRFNHSAVYDEANSRMIVFGGSILGGGVLRDAWALNLPAGAGTPSWTSLADGPTDLASHSASYDFVGRRMIVFGGNDGSLPTNAVFSLSLPAGTGSPAWTTLIASSGNPPGGRFEHTSVLDALNERMIVFGGTESTGPVDETWVLPLRNPPVMTLGAYSGSPPTPRMSHSAVYDPLFERMIVFSGDDGTVFPIDDLAWPLGF